MIVLKGEGLGMAFYVYILKCADNSYYTGHTDNIEERLASHHKGENKSYTQTRRPIELVYMQEFSTRSEALQAERKIKGWSRAKKEALIKKDWQNVKKLAKKIFKK